MDKLHFVNENYPKGEKMSKENELKAAVLESVDRVKALGYTVLYAANYGSHNYNLDINNEEYKSDIDTKVIILPTLKELVNNSKPVSTIIEISTGQCDIKDIRAFVQNITKGHIQFLELLCAQSSWINIEYADDFMWFINNIDNLINDCRPQLLKSIYGMSLEKQKALCHPYPTIKWKIDKWGYDGKQLHHIIRLKDFINSYFFENKDFKEAIWYNEEDINKDLLISIKENKISLEDAIAFARIYCDVIKEKVDKLLLNDCKEIGYKDKYLKHTNQIIINNIKKQILEEANEGNRNCW